ncbi:alpha/beta fold hydrolase [Actinotalea sp. AC32]|nr:alpha/beta fold hydrolase [Actinotalea sp. AC32]
MRTFERDGLTFDVRDTGPDGGGTVVLLHGFPQDGSAYDDVAPLLAEAGLRVLVPDQRGYSPGARPTHRAAYALGELVDDVAALLDAADVERAHVVGHDWGGSVAWAFASRHADRTETLTALSTPHPAAMRAALAHGQAARSWYMAAFQLPRVPETRLLADDGAALLGALVRTGLPAEQARRYVDRMREPGALRAAIGWYRALPLAGRTRVGRSRVPTTYVHGSDDPFFAPRAATDTARFVAAPCRVLRLDAGHWLPETHPDEVGAAVLDRVASTSGGGRVGPVRR